MATNADVVDLGNQLDPGQLRSESSDATSTLLVAQYDLKTTDANPRTAMPQLHVTSDPSDVLLTRNTDTLSLPELCAVVRTTANASTLHEAALRRLEEVVGVDGVGATDSEHAEEALGVCVECHLSSVRVELLPSPLVLDPPQIRKRLLYTVATTSHFDEGVAPHPSLPAEITNLCATLQDHLISHFTPILFTVATASHMSCTDVFAEMWMPLVIAPALANSGLCRPIETLRTIQQVDWEQHGLCAECCQEKRAEWEDEIELVWRKTDDWI